MEKVVVKEFKVSAEIFMKIHNFISDNHKHSEVFNLLEEFKKSTPIFPEPEKEEDV
jgi:hypothetical protein